MIIFFRRWLLFQYMLYYRLLRPVIFMQSAQDAHARVMRLLSKADNSDVACFLAGMIHFMASRKTQIKIGGALWDSPFCLAAGFVKGYGFENENQALRAVRQGENIIPGWRMMPKLVGIVEFGSFTRQPRIGNPGTVMWRDAKTQSTQNRVGLKNPGAIAAAQFLSERRQQLPRIYGINIAVSPGVRDEAQEISDIQESILAFLERRVLPTWFTLNISCPNTEDDPGGNQTEAKTRRLCEAAIKTIREQGYNMPLFVKISPDLADEQYRILMQVFAETGVKAVIATNTLAKPAPDGSSHMAGIGGGRLHENALHAADFLNREKIKHNYPVDVIGCGGVLDAAGYVRYKARGIQAVQYWSALVYRGPLAAAWIESETV